jgi:hypothetical protein
MTNEELQDFLSKLEPGISKDDALFEIYYQQDEVYGDCFVKANQDGLRLLAVELLQASIHVGQSAIEPAWDTILLEHGEMFSNGNVILHQIEPTLEKKQAKVDPPPVKSTWKDRLASSGCIGILVLIVIAIVVGLFNILGWLFSL